MNIRFAMGRRAHPTTRRSHLGRQRTWSLRLVALLALSAIGLLAASCSSSTTVQSGERVINGSPTAAADAPPAEESTVAETPTSVADDGGSDAAPTPDGSNQADGSDDTAGDAAGTGTAGQVGDILDVGGDAQVKSLIDDCEAGSDLACDILFQVTEFGSDEEAIATDCGGRGRPVDSGFCTEGIVNDGENLWFAADSPALAGIVDDCESRDMTACDFLFFRSEVGSEYETIGNSCAGLTEVALPDCRTQFGS